MATGSLGHTLFAFNGRINRGKFWLGQVLGLVISYALLGASAFLSPGLFTYDGVGALPPVHPLTWVFLGLAFLVAIWISLATMIKRCHDRGKSGWWSLIVLIPIAGFIWMIIELGTFEGEPGTNAWGPNPLGPQTGHAAVAR
ncbi:MAG: hypothetical protein RL291_1389 [Pseudomonadota bacterium]